MIANTLNFIDGFPQPPLQDTPKKDRLMNITAIKLMFERLKCRGTGTQWASPLSGLRTGSLQACMLLLGLILCASNQATAEPERHFEVDGQLHFKSDSPPAERSFNFHILVDNCEWIIKTDKNPIDPIHQYTETAFDGSNVYQYCLWEDAFAPKATEGMNAKATATIKPGTVPEFDFHNTMLLWLAFASECNITSLRDGTLPWGLISPPPNTESNYFVAVATTFDEKDPAFVTSVVNMHEGYATQRDGTQLAMPPPYDRGYTNFIYSVTATTNVGNTKLPLEFSLKSFNTKPNGSSSKDLDVLWEVHGVVITMNARPARKVCRPAIVTETHVRDYSAATFTNVAYISYYTTNSWLHRTNPFYSVLVDSMHHANDFPSLAKHRVVYAFLSFAVLTLLGSFIISRRSSAEYKKVNIN